MIWSAWFFFPHSIIEVLLFPQFCSAIQLGLLWSDCLFLDCCYWITGLLEVYVLWPSLMSCSSNVVVWSDCCEDYYSSFTVPNNKHSISSIIMFERKSIYSCFSFVELFMLGLFLPYSKSLVSFLGFSYLFLVWMFL